LFKEIWIKKKGQNKMKILEVLNKIQKELKAPKNQVNNFGHYNYRSCEDILEAVKPLLGEAILTISDEIVLIGNRYYVKAIATIQIDGEKLFVEAFAREAEDKKGMDESQITGASSSYARKYALNGLFLIDDTKDADSQEAPKKDKVQDVKEKIKEIEKSPLKNATDNQIINIKALCLELKKDIGLLENSLGCKITELGFNKAEELITKLQNKKAELAGKENE
jgi:hypothetical protein